MNDEPKTLKPEQNAPTPPAPPITSPSPVAASKNTNALIFWIVGVIVVIGAAAAFIAIRHRQSALLDHANEQLVKATEQQDALSKNANDNLIKTEVTNVVSAVTEYMSNNSGVLPDSQTSLDQALSTTDISGHVVYKADLATGEKAANQQTYFYAPRYMCSDDMQTITPTSSNRTFAVVGLLSSGKLYCQQL